MIDNFWMVLRNPDVVNGMLDRKFRPGFVHDTKESAEKQAERLAIQFNESFLILEGVAWVRPTTTEVPGLPPIVPVYEVTSP